METEGLERSSKGEEQQCGCNENTEIQMEETDVTDNLVSGRHVSLLYTMF
jgi:hypothetical protein